MMTQWHTETYRAPRWFGSRIRCQVCNADGKVMISDLDPTVAAAIVAEHNIVVVAMQEMRDEQSP